MHREVLGIHATVNWRQHRPAGLCGAAEMAQTPGAASPAAPHHTVMGETVGRSHSVPGGNCTTCMALPLSKSAVISHLNIIFDSRNTE